MPYPLEIHVTPNENENDEYENSYRRRHNKEELKFWKEKAQSLEAALEELEGKVTALEKGSPASGDEGGRVSSPTSFKAAEPLMGQVASPAASSASPSLTKTDGESATQQKDEIIQELVSEMERLIEHHASKLVEEGNANNDEDKDEDKDEDANDDIPTRRQIKIETSTLEALLRKALETTDAQAAAIPETVSQKPKMTKSESKKKKKDDRILYQLSCKHCVGQNYVGSIKRKGNLRDKVKEHYSVVWQVVQTAYGKGDGGGEGEAEAEDLEKGMAFRISSFAHHAGRHCQNCNSGAEVTRWCMENVKVERISKHSMRHLSMYKTV